ncbi:MAG: hypothetical protein QXD48_01805 [Candidatus Aenigmatarchaeota archaeon]
MKKTTKKKLMVITIILIFGMSTIAFVATNIMIPTEIKKLENPIIVGEIDTNTEYHYIQNGYTFFRFYYENEIPSYIDDLPYIFVTNINQIQLFVLKIPANETYIKIRNLNGEIEIFNITMEDIYDALCETLIVTPSECGLRQMINRTTEKTNTTE